MIRFTKYPDGFHFVVVTRRICASAGPFPDARSASNVAFAWLRPTFPGDYVKKKGKIERYVDPPKEWKEER